MRCRKAPAEQDHTCEGCHGWLPCRFVPAIPITRRRPDGAEWKTLTVPGWYCATCRGKR